VKSEKTLQRYFRYPLAAALTLCLILSGLSAGVLQAAQNESKATIAVLSHTDFLPDATGVYGKRSRHGDMKMAGGDGHVRQRIGQDEAYDNVDREHGYDAEAVGLPEVLADAILEQLTRSNRFTPVERKALRTAILEQRFGQQLQKSYLDKSLDSLIQSTDTMGVGGGIAAGSMVAGAKTSDMLRDFRDLGTAIGAQYLVLGNLHKLGSKTVSKAVPFSDRGRTVNKKISEARLKLRVIDAASSTVLGADSLNVKVSAMLLDTGEGVADDFAFMDSVARQAAVKILDIIFPARVVSANPLIISRGSNDNIKAGDRFIIYREGKAITEPSTGAVIAHLKETIGDVQVTRVDETIAFVEPGQAGQFKVGDLAKLQTPEPVAASVPTRAAAPIQPGAARQPGQLPVVAIGLVKAGSTARTGAGSGEHVALFTDTIISKLVQSKRFKVIDRQEVDQLLDEQTAQAIAENRDLPSAMGTLKGCDYIVLGAIQNFSREETSIKLPNSSRIITVLDGYAEGNMRIVDARSGDIIESRKISVQQQQEIQAGEERLTAALADAFASRVVANLLNAIYPIKIAAVAPDGSLYINRGTDGELRAGATLEVFRQGQKIIDPDTGVELGSMDSTVGTLQLSKVEDNRSIGRMISGNAPLASDLLKLVTNGQDTAAPGGSVHTGGTLPGAAAGAVTAAPAGVGQAPTVKGRATLALMKISLNARKKFDDASRVSGIQEGTMDQITDNLVDALAKTNRFNMMERRQIDQLIDEKVFQVASQGGDIRQYLKEVQGSDYLVIGELTNFYLHTVRKKVPYVDEIEVQQTGFIEGNLRIVDGHTSKIIATEKVRIKKKFRNLGFEEIRTRLIDIFVHDAAAAIVQRIYPIKVLAALPDGTIYLNRGTDGGVREGLLYSVQRPGQELIDPDSGVSFGTADTEIGTLVTTAVEGSRSRAKMVSGEMAIKGDILRNPRPAPKKQAPKMEFNW
jgi:curli biogenesis system outer membrane secretion channel CsgG